MLRWMLRVDSWLDVASLENAEEDHSFLFLKKNSMKIFFVFFFLNLENLKFLKELKILIFFFFEKIGNLEFLKEFEKIWLMNFFFFENGLRNMSPMPLISRPFLKISFFFLKYEDLFIIKKWRRWRWRWSKSDEDLFMMIFFFFWKTYPLNENNFGWKSMRIAR